MLDRGGGAHTNHRHIKIKSCSRTKYPLARVTMSSLNPIHWPSRPIRPGTPPSTAPASRTHWDTPQHVRVLIENVWRTMKQRIKARLEFPNTVAKMRQAVQEEWNRLKPGDWNKYIDNMPRRIKEVKERDGMATSF